MFFGSFNSFFRCDLIAHCCCFCLLLPYHCCITRTVNIVPYRTVCVQPNHVTLIKNDFASLNLSFHSYKQYK